MLLVFGVNLTPTTSAPLSAGDIAANPGTLADADAAFAAALGTDPSSVNVVNITDLTTGAVITLSSRRLQQVTPAGVLVTFTVNLGKFPSQTIIDNATATLLSPVLCASALSQLASSLAAAMNLPASAFAASAPAGLALANTGSSSVKLNLPMAAAAVPGAFDMPLIAGASGGGGAALLLIICVAIVTCRRCRKVKGHAADKNDQDPQVAAVVVNPLRQVDHKTEGGRSTPPSASKSGEGQAKSNDYGAELGDDVSEAPAKMAPTALVIRHIAIAPVPTSRTHPPEDVPFSSAPAATLPPSPPATPLPSPSAALQPPPPPLPPTAPLPLPPSPATLLLPPPPPPAMLPPPPLSAMFPPPPPPTVLPPPATLPPLPQPQPLAKQLPPSSAAQQALAPALVPTPMLVLPPAALPAPPAATLMSQPTANSLPVVDIDELGRDELRVLCQARGLSTEGKVKELRARLRDAAPV